MSSRVLYGLVFLIATTGCSSWFKRSDKAVIPPPAPVEKIADAPTTEQSNPPATDPKADSITQAQTSPVTLATSETPPVSNESTDKPWSFEGTNGPEAWGDLKPEYTLCKTGKTQSPVNLKWSKPRAGGEIQLNYKPTDLKMIDNGFTLVINTEDGGSAMLHGEPYKLTEVRFRTPSEHQISGSSLSLEVQFMHRNKKGGTAVVSAILIEGASNPEIEKLWHAWPNIKSAEMEIANETFNPMVLLPRKTTHYAYQGSLTTPPCTEGVKWFVLNTPVEISKEQIAGFRSHYPKNNRPVQPLNGRKVINY